MTAGDQNPLVLVVDDYADAREMYAEYLECVGFRVAQASNGAEALEQAFALTPDVVLMDMSLPVLDGWEATGRLKADPRTRHIKVVGLSGHALQDLPEQTSAGCDAYIVKPCMPDDVVSQIWRVLGQSP